MNPHIFREYDVRGLVDEDLDPGTVSGLGRAYGARILETGGDRVAVGRDVRESSPALETALVEGIRSTGVSVVRLGLVPTPLAYFAVHHLDLAGCVQITGSHNPVAYNGFKMMEGKGSLYGEAIQDLWRRMDAGTFPSGAGTVEDLDLAEIYLADILSRVRPARGLKVVVDAGNGCGSRLGPELLRRAGCEVEELYCEYDGTFPNHIPDPTVPQTLVMLRRRVAEGGADLGIAFDGDADRLGALDDRGRVVWGDQLLALFAREVLRTHPGSPILFEVKCSRALIEDIEAHGGRPVMTRTGHSLIKQAMKETGSPLAGEMSGHLFFADDWYGFDDALFAAIRLVSLIASGPDSLAERVDELPRYHATPELRVYCEDGLKFQVVAEVLRGYRGTHQVNDVDGARVEFAGGWGLVRASNTQPALVLRAEGVTPQDRDAIHRELQSRLRDLGVDPDRDA